MVNQCANCHHGELLASNSEMSERLLANLDAQSNSLWNTALKLTELAAAMQDPESGELPATKADIDQKQEFVLGVTTRLTRVSGELAELVSMATADAAEIDCDSNKSEADQGHCPRLLRLLSIHPQVQELLEEAHNPQI